MTTASDPRDTRDLIIPAHDSILESHQSIAKVRSPSGLDIFHARYGLSSGKATKRYLGLVASLLTDLPVKNSWYYW